jgi:multidrug efflux pump subunit AcrB
MVRTIIEFTTTKFRLNHILFVLIIILGSYAYKNIPKEIFPPANLDSISISGSYVGSSPAILDKLAVMPIEDELKNISEISKIESVVKNGSFLITSHLKDGSNIDDALDEAKDAISKIKVDLPSDMVEPTAKKVVSSFPLITIAVVSKEGKEDLINIANRLKRDLSSIEDLSDISIRGDSDKELLFKLNHKKIVALGLSFNTVISAISSLSNTFPIGLIEQKGNHLYLNTQSGFKDIQKIRDSIIKVGDKRVVVSQIAKVEFKLADALLMSHFNGVENISIDISKAESGNAMTLVKDIKKTLSRYNKLYPKFKFDTYADSSIWIKNRLNTVVSNILFGLILVSLSVYIFINARISFVVAIGIPTSFLIGLIFMDIFGYSLNMLSLLGALIALGMLVDEAIVVSENIQRHIEEGDEPHIAAINGAYEMFPAVMTATATTIFAFLPLLIISGEMGVFMKILPIMISILLLSSLFEAFIFLPLHAKEILKKETKQKRSDLIWDSLKVRYVYILNIIFAKPKKTLVVFVTTVLVLTGVLLKFSKFQLFPDFDTTQVFIKGTVNKNNSLKDTSLLTTDIERVLLDNLPSSEVASITSITGMQLDNKYIPQVSQNYFQIFINLHERAPEGFYNSYINPIFSPEYDSSNMIRKKSAKDISKVVQDLTAKFASNPLYEEFEVIVPGAGIVKSDIEISLSGDTKEVKKAINLLKNEIVKAQGTSSITDNLKSGTDEIIFSLTPYGQSLGISEKSISNLLRPLYLKAQVSNMYLNSELIKVKTQDINKDSIDSLKTLLVDLPLTNQKVLLGDVVSFQNRKNFSTTFKENGLTIWTITGSLDKSIITSSDLMKKIEPTVQEIKKSGISVMIKGEQQENTKIQSEMLQAALIALFLIFIALVWMFDSFKLSLMVLTTIPLSIFGVLLGHMIMGLNLTMPGLLGIVGLIGVVVNDGIIMIDFLKRAKSHSDMLEFATKRLRPILLTSITTILGLSTLIFFASGQTVILQPMAVSLGFGLAWATVLNLLFLPLVFYVVNRSRIQ